MDCSLFSPIRNLPWYLWPVWPLIFWRIQRLKAWFRRAGGPGSQMLWGVDHWGRVNILALSDDLSGYQPPQTGITLAPSPAWRALLAGQAETALSLPNLTPCVMCDKPLAGAVFPRLARLIHGLPRPET